MGGGDGREDQLFGVGKEIAGRRVHEDATAHRRQPL